MSFATYPQQLMPAFGNQFFGQQVPVGVPWIAPQAQWGQLVTVPVPQNGWSGPFAGGFDGINTGYQRQMVPSIHAISAAGPYAIDPVTAVAFQQAVIQQLQHLQRLQQIQHLQQLQQLQQLTQFQPLQPYTQLQQLQPYSQLLQQPLQPVQALQPQLIPVAV
jgi:hypothetical protein